MPHLTSPSSPPHLPSISEEDGEEEVGAGEHDPTAEAAVVPQLVGSGARTPVRLGTSERKSAKGRLIPRASAGSPLGKSPTKTPRKSSPDRPYSPPSPYALSPSPSSSPASSPPSSPQPRRDTKKRKIKSRDAENLQIDPKRTSVISPLRANVATPTARTPHRRTESPRKSFPSTPDSGARYQRVLVPPQTTREGNGEPHQESQPSLMERFEAVYSSLKNKPPADHNSRPSGSEDELDLEPASPEDLGGEPSLTSEAGVPRVGHRRTRVLTRAPPCPHVTVTSGDGRRVFLRLKGRHQDERGVSEPPHFQLVC